MSAPNFSDVGIIVDPAGRTEQRVRCPHCSQRERDGVLGVNIDSGAFHCFRCGWKGRAGGANTEPRPLARLDDPAIADRKRERLRQTWKQTLPLTHVKASAVRTYLEARALGEILKSPPSVLRAHPSLEYWDGTQSLGRFPAMVGLFHGAAGAPVTLHVTYLRNDGYTKAGVPSPKKILGVPVRGSTKGGAIRLHEPRRGVLGVAEGIESALSLHLLKGFPVWAAFCACNLEHLRLPDDLSELHIGIDVDESGKGEAVAKALADRVLKWRRHPKITIWRPDVPGFGDLNDELRRRAG